MNQVAISHNLEKSCLRLYDQNQNLLSSFDLTHAAIPEKLANSLLKAIQLEFGHTSLETQRQTFRCARKLVAFLSQEHVEVRLPLPATTPFDFHKWLAKSSICGATAQSHQNAVLTLLKWCQRNTTGIISGRANIAAPSFRREAPKTRTPLTESSVRDVLDACYREIDEIEKTRAHGERLLLMKFNDAKDESLGTLLAELIEVGGGKIPSYATLINKNPKLVKRVAEAGGLDHIKGLIYTNPRAMFPFYLAVLCQTAGNPTPIAKMSIACLEQHPIRSDIEVINWYKPRSNSEQRAEFPASKQWSAPSIVRRYILASKNVRDKLAKSYHKDHLFIALPNRGTSSPRVPCSQLMHNMLSEFITKHALQEFDFKDIRIHSAHLHRKTKGGIISAKHKLNHKSLKSTQLYLNPTDVSPQHDKYIHSFQGRIISIAKDANQPAGKSEKTWPKTQSKSLETVFGFTCSDPLSGISGNSNKGSVCLYFTGCATCPGAVVPVDDPAVVSRLLTARHALKAAQTRALKEGWLPRFNQFYLDTLKILESEIIPMVSSSVISKAETLASSHSIPFLE